MVAQRRWDNLYAIRARWVALWMLWTAPSSGRVVSIRKVQPSLFFIVLCIVGLVTDNEGYALV